MTFSLLEAYIATSILIDTLEKIDGPITKEKILEKLESLKNYPFKGLTLTFNPERRDLAHSIWLETGDDTDWVEKNINLTQFKKDDYGKDSTSRGPDSLTKQTTNPPA